MIPRGAARLALLLLLATLLPAPTAHAAADALPAGELEIAVEEHALATDGRYAYVIGGASCVGFADCETLDAIQRYDPQTRQTQLMQGRLPEPRSGAMAVSDGASVYVLGGMDDRTIIPKTTIYRYDIAADEVTALHVELPIALAQSSVAVIGSKAYLVGGATETGTSDRIVVFDMASLTTSSSRVTLPAEHHIGAAATDGHVVYVFGGLAGTYNAAWAQQDAIWRYDPSTDALEVMRAKLPGPLVRVSAVWDGSFAYVIGGDGSALDMGMVRRYDPVSDTITIMDGVVTPGRNRAHAFWDGAAAYVVGGRLDSDASSASVSRYDPAADTPPAERASAPRAEAPAPAAWLAQVDATQRLPSARAAPAAAWTGDAVWLFGGRDAGGNPLDEIVRVDTATGEARTMDARLPSPRDGAGAFFDGTHVYVVGGHAGGEELDEILRYDIDADAITTIGATLPRVDGYVYHHGGNLGWDGVHAYVFGGAFTDTIVRFDPARGTVETMGARLPQGMWDAAIAWDGEAFHLFGGWDGYLAAYGNQVVRYDPALDKVSTVPDARVGDRYGASAIHDGAATYVFGGWNARDGELGDILQFDAASGTLRTLDARLPAPVSSAAAVWDGHAAWLLGGVRRDAVIDEVVRLGPTHEHAHGHAPQTGDDEDGDDHGDDHGDGHGSSTPTGAPSRVTPTAEPHADGHTDASGHHGEAHDTPGPGAALVALAAAAAVLLLRRAPRRP